MQSSLEAHFKLSIHLHSTPSTYLREIKGTTSERLKQIRDLENNTNQVCPRVIRYLSLPVVPRPVSFLHASEDYIITGGRVPESAEHSEYRWRDVFEFNDVKSGTRLYDGFTDDPPSPHVRTWTSYGDTAYCIMHPDNDMLMGLSWDTSVNISLSPLVQNAHFQLLSTACTAPGRFLR